MAKRRLAAALGASEPVTAERIEVRKRAPRPAGCRQYLRRELADALPRICEELLNRIVSDRDAATLKLLWQMASLDRPEGPAAEGGPGSRELGPRELGFARRALKVLRAPRETGGEGVRQECGRD